jgi:hypothetical protein
MKAYLLISGTIFALFGAFHVFITYQHFRRPGIDLGEVIGPAIIALCGAGLAIWAFRLSRGAPGRAA